MGENLLRSILALAGGFIIFTGIDAGLGGIATLGLQETRDFFTVTDPSAFDIHDSHARFLGGLWAGIGLGFVGGAVRLRQFRPALYLCFAAIFVGGLARLSSHELDVVLGPALAGPLVAELVGMPLLFVWTWLGTSGRIEGPERKTAAAKRPPQQIRSVRTATRPPPRRA